MNKFWARNMTEKLIKEHRLPREMSLNLLRDFDECFQLQISDSLA